MHKRVYRFMYKLKNDTNKSYNLYFKYISVRCFMRPTFKWKINKLKCSKNNLTAAGLELHTMPRTLNERAIATQHLFAVGVDRQHHLYG